MKLKRTLKAKLPSDHKFPKYENIIKKENPTQRTIINSEGEEVTIIYYVYTIERYCEKSYEEIVNTLIREKYSADKVEAILFNYLNNPADDHYRLEFNIFQAYREECKTKAKVFVFEREEMLKNKN
jgi:hypothetical protein